MYLWKVFRVVLLQAAVVAACETGWAKDDSNDGDICFLSLKSCQSRMNFARWGWTNLVTDDMSPSHTLTIYTAANKCAIASAQVAGTAVVTFESNGVRVVITPDERYTLPVTHVYVGPTTLPEDKEGKCTISPNQMTQNIGAQRFEYFFEVGAVSQAYVMVNVRACLTGGAACEEGNEGTCKPIIRTLTGEIPATLNGVISTTTPHKLNKPGSHLVNVTSFLQNPNTYYYDPLTPKYTFLPAGTSFKFECPDDGSCTEGCTFYLVLYDCEPNSEQFNGGWPQILEGEPGWESRSCGLSFKTSDQPQTQFPMVIYRFMMGLDTYQTFDSTADTRFFALFAGPTCGSEWCEPEEQSSTCQNDVLLP